ncbi:MAG: hypothetical protein LAT54_09195 [Cryomorphaceae bacterium]|nr:hypothetical protein [Cryomorphaceae bacterium]
MKKSALLFAMILFGFVAQAQYEQAIGLRFGFPSGLTYKKFVSDKNAIEGILHLGNGIGLTGLYQIHNQAFGVDNLNWYYGFGGHVHISNRRHFAYGNGWRYSGRNTRPVDGDIDVGVNGVLGLEYTVPTFPIVFALDISPIIGMSSAGYTYIGTASSLAIRFYF